jgi:hypothetical protein
MTIKRDKRWSRKQDILRSKENKGSRELQNTTQKTELNYNNETLIIIEHAKLTAMFLSCKRVSFKLNIYFTLLPLLTNCRALVLKIFRNFKAPSIIILFTVFKKKNDRVTR